MSIIEIQKTVNSDLVEPLNFNNYINDISVFGLSSYVMDKSNEKLWRKLLTNSLTLFGHDAIHEEVYARMTEDDIDYMILYNRKLGQSFNSFYNLDGEFNSGKIDDVLLTINSEKYNKLEPKLQAGINRYISKKLEEPDVATWIENNFKVNMVHYTDINSIMADTTFWMDTVLNFEPLRFILCMGVSSIQWIINNDSEIFRSFIETVCTSTEATMELIRGIMDSGKDSNTVDAKLDAFFDNEFVCECIANNAGSVTGLMYISRAMASYLNSTHGSTKFANSSIAVDIFIDRIQARTNMETPLTNVKTSLDSITDDIEILEGYEQATDSLDNILKDLDVCIKDIKDANGSIDDLIATVNTILNSAAAMSAIANSAAAMSAIANSAAAMSAIANSAAALYAIIKNSNASTKISSPLQKYRSNIYNILKNSTDLFSYSTKTIGNGSGTWDDGANTNTFYIPYSCYDDKDTDYYVGITAGSSSWVASIGRHDNTVNISSGICLRGTRVYGSGSSVGNVSFYVFTAK